MTPQFFIGWDVGGWNCDKNPESRDAIVILDSNLAITGTPWRGNLREAINGAATTLEWLEQLFALCKTNLPTNAQAILAIDTPLGFSEAFRRLVTQWNCEEPIGKSATNPYLFRETERFLFENGLKPLSPIKDMIGSQATKGIHVLAKFAPRRVQCGVWSDGHILTAIEAYPSACKDNKSPTIQDLRQQYESCWNKHLKHQDEKDALTCALIGYLFVTQPDALAYPKESTSRLEGWIWVPKDTLCPVSPKPMLAD